MSNPDRSRSDSAIGGEPPSAAVPGNLWTEIEPPELGGIRDAPSVSIVVEELDGEPAADLDLTLAGLERQTYPANLIETRLPGVDYGGRELVGEVLIFLAAGAVPGPTMVEGHVRWHLEVSDAVTAGPMRPLDSTGLGASRVREAAAAGELAIVSDSRPGSGPEPLGMLEDLTRGLTEYGHGLYRAGALGNIGMRRSTHTAIGGEAAGPGGHVRRLDRAQRLACYGALFVPDPAAVCWAACAGTLAAVAGLDPEAKGDPDAPTAGIEAAGLIPAPPFRRLPSPRRHRRPAMVVNLDAAGATADELSSAAETIVDGRCGDLELRIQLAAEHPERAEIETLVASDDRIVFGPRSTESFCASPVQVTMPGVVMPDRRTLGDLCELVLAEGVGAIRVTVPGVPPVEAMVHAYASGALARSRRVAASTGEPLDQVLIRLFGERWMSGVEVSLRPHGVDEAEITEHGLLAPATDLDEERTKHLRYRRLANELAARTAIQDRRLVKERLRVRAARSRAARVETLADEASQQRS
jgi:hypothetical protein